MGQTITTVSRETTDTIATLVMIAFYGTTVSRETCRKERITMWTVIACSVCLGVGTVLGTLIADWLNANSESDE